MTPEEMAEGYAKNQPVTNRLCTFDREVRAYLAGYDAAKAEQRWIPVSEGLPTNDADGVVYGSILLYGISAKKRFEWVEKNKCDYPFGPTRFIGGYVPKYGFLDDGYPNCEITHWMPLPEPPKEDHD